MFGKNSFTQLIRILMKTKYLVIKLLLYALLVAFGFLGVHVASLTIDRYDIVVRGILGMVIVYYILREASSSNDREGFNRLLVFPQNIKYFVIAFLYAMVSYWALSQVVDMFLSLK
jgi:hypothetical protein